MKKILILFAVVIFASCSKDDKPGDVHPTKFEQIKTTLPEGQWKVSTFIVGQSDKTSDFESFVFTFNQDGTVIGETDLFSETGTWTYDNTSSTSEKLVLVFGETDPFPELNDDWDILSVTNSKVELSDNNNATGGTLLLSFTKI